MMNLSEMLTAIKMDLGIYSLHLPIEDKDMYEVIKLRSIRTYSQFFPHIQEVRFDIDELKTYSKSYQKTTVELPDVFGGRRIIYVKEVDLDSEFVNAGYLAPEANASIQTFENLALTTANMHALSTLSPSFTFEFHAPNRLTLYNHSIYADIINVKLAVEHFDNLSSISPSTFDTFYELASLDIKNYLYGILKHYTEISTPYGTINLRIDDYQSAADERKTLIETWRSRNHLDNFDIFIH